MLTIAQIHRLLLYTSIVTGARSRTAIEDQSLWDHCDPVFAEIVELAESVVSSLSASATADGTLRLFTLDRGIVGPLYDTARRCRHPQIRRKAISLLYRNPWQEGMWDSVLAARVAERVMEMEEEGLGQPMSSAEIHDHHRLDAAVPSFEMMRRRATVRYSRCQSTAPLAAANDIVEVIEW
jgi:hypothetical protein